MFALVDCNNFFVSCERDLDKDLEGKPVVVLSNNDGCVISRSEEAKALGVPMGAPAFKYEKFFKEHNIVSLSSKFELYNFRSQKVMKIIKQYAPETEVYSIDEAFLNLSGFRYINILEHCRKLKQEVQDVEGIPVSVGIAPSKTLAKVANRIAKKNPEKFGGFFVLEKPEDIEKALKWLNIEDVWGIGRRLSARMKDAGIYKAYDLFSKPEMWIRKQMGVNGVRLVNELKGIPQFEIPHTSGKKSIAVTRSFMEMVTKKEDLQERIGAFAFSAGEKLRRQKSCCKSITVFVNTNRYRKDLPEYKNAASYSFPNPVSSSIDLAKTAARLLDEIYIEGYHYKRAGVWIHDFVPEDERLISLFEEDHFDKHKNIMEAMDKLNRRYGKDKIRLGNLDFKSNYGRKKLSQAYEDFLKNNTLPEADYRFQ
ncbi:SOS mutagenesis and repair protein UmuC [Elizabethkingia meningoseptica]|uniref:Y-family DNA polymerase n=1 Tax=Elizabethkingia meningoseptica TaxID=238 RepID=UPI00099987FC|nr:Y-family DNA polymerase [Elizabethkingia meningoseptica]OPC24839.1 SOS mutagenesis and repair protein UmuC [Elizabethkingia meningoseptica]